MAKKKEDREEQPGVTAGGTTDQESRANDIGDRALFDRDRDIQRVKEATDMGLQPGGSAAEVEPIGEDVPNPKKDPGGHAPTQEARAGEGADEFSAQAATRPSGSGGGAVQRQQEGPGTLGMFPLIGGFPANERAVHFERAQAEQKAAVADLQGRGSPHRKPGQPAPVAAPTAEGGGPAGEGSGPLGGS